MIKKSKYIYREFNNEFGYKENMNVTQIFDNTEDLLEMINCRKKFYSHIWNMRKIEIEIVPEKLDIALEDLKDSDIK